MKFPVKYHFTYVLLFFCIPETFSDIFWKTFYALTCGVNIEWKKKVIFCSKWKKCGGDKCKMRILNS
jgi:hypothetical protein